jgi:D-beta-D-heptose 7-phosphate kinase/D-beta-D-heptose 1-phosphate adenosyltransferase
MNRANLGRERAEQILADFLGKRVLVVGDVMLDEFTWGRVQRISPEAPVPVVEVMRETDGLGGAGNVAANIRALGGEPIMIGVIGRDAPADRLVSLFRELGINPGHLLADDRRTTLKTRIIANNQQVVRTDREDRTPISAKINETLRGRFLDLLPQADTVVISDYDKGIVNRQLLGDILPEAGRAGVPVFLDPKVHHANYYQPTTVITPNHREAELLAGLAIADETGLEEAGRRLLDRFKCNYVLITRGEAGMSLFHGTEAHHLPTAAREVFDVTGAGDTVIAGLALASAGGASMEEAALVANHAAGLVVGKVGTATVTQQELLEDFNSRNAYPPG